MAENYSKSKLKRRKFWVEGKFTPTDSRRETTPPGATGKGGSTESGSSGAQEGYVIRTCSPFPAATARRSCHQPPPETKSLWVVALSAVEGLQGGLVPELPPPSAATPSSDRDGWRWCDLSAEVDPFPQSSCRSLVPSSQSFVQQEAEQRADPLTETPPPRTTEGGRSDSSQRGSGSVGEEEEHGGRGELQSCPMCLQEFPSGFSQMDRDSHLAQCLSAMNVDVTW
ncbi:hypothetical protein OJAV_G00071890 [Oryzias javanicus]|uniref:UBZ2-type domain-containing protein n=1 Tax=Oryzias javanicus TaxID=123683 RepID=A0A437D7V3_ORYJA|nr:hypothetical protein OJAV_G00071890 [Oryzias javanicus]